jgi:hypothetical protein
MYMQYGLNDQSVCCCFSVVYHPTGPSGAALLAQAKEVKKACANNWAAVELKRKNWGEAASQATKVRRQPYTLNNHFQALGVGL